MLKPGADENDIRMTDVLCDFCQRPWSDDVPFVEGHRGAVICGNCLTIAYAEVIAAGAGAARAGYHCILCREGDADRAALDRAGEAGWQSPAHPGVAVCARCIRQAAGALHTDPDFDWRKP